MILGGVSSFFRLHGQNTSLVLLFIEILQHLRWSALPLDTLKRAVPQLLRVLPSLYTQHHSSGVLSSLSNSLSLLLHTPQADPAQAEIAVASLFSDLSVAINRLVSNVEDAVRKEQEERGEEEEEIKEDNEAKDYRLVPRWNEDERLKEIGCKGAAGL